MSRSVAPRDDAVRIAGRQRRLASSAPEAAAATAAFGQVHDGVRRGEISISSSLAEQSADIQAIERSGSFVYRFRATATPRRRSRRRHGIASYLAQSRATSRAAIRRHPRYG
jgi:hypothetical protein